MKKIFLMLAGALLMAACSNNDDTGTLPASNADRDWFAIEDSSDPLDHARYEIYDKFGISVFYTDTLGVEARGTDGYGDPLTHVEMLAPFYNVTNISEGYSYKLSTDRDALLIAVEKLRTDIIAGMIPNHYPRAILLVDELKYTNPLNRVETLSDVYVGTRAAVISEVDQLSAMNEDQQQGYVDDVLAAVWYDYARMNYPEEITEFFNVSEETWGANALVNDNDRGIYGKTMYIPVNADPEGTARFYRDNWMCFGFLSNAAGSTLYQLSGFTPGVGMWAAPGIYTQYTFPSQTEDAIAYIKAVGTYATAAEFDAWWQALPENTTVDNPNTLYDTTNRWGDLLTRKYTSMKSLIDQIKTDTAR